MSDGGRPRSARTMQVIVAHKAPLAEGIMGFELRAADGGVLPPFAAGAHLDVYLPNGLVRQYSLCNDPDERDRYQIGVLLEPEGRGGSRSAHEEIVVGDTITIGEPRNQFSLEPSGHYLLVAGGIGVTPLLSMADVLARERASFAFHYCTRSLDRTAFLERMRQASYAACVQYHFDDSHEQQRFDPESVLAAQPPDTRLYICGPAGFMDWVIAVARSSGWPEDHIHREYFASGHQATDGDASFELEIVDTGTVVTVGPDETAAQAMLAAGVEVPLSCEQGICGTCAMRVVEGVPDHRDQYFSAAEHETNEFFTPCCSRAISPRLVIEF